MRLVRTALSGRIKLRVPEFVLLSVISTPRKVRRVQLKSLQKMYHWLLTTTVRAVLIAASGLQVGDITIDWPVCCHSTTSGEDVPILVDEGGLDNSSASHNGVSMWVHSTVPKPHLLSKVMVWVSARTLAMAAR